MDILASLQDTHYHTQKDLKSTIRKPLLSDIDQLMILINNIMQDGMHFFSNGLYYSKPEYEKFLNNLNNYTIMLIAVIGSEIVGWAILSRRRYQFKYHLGNLVIGVKQEHRNKGIGSQLLAAMEQLASEKGIEKIDAYVRASDNNALDFLKKLYFVQEGYKTKSIKFNNSYDDEVVMSKILL